MSWGGDNCGYGVRVGRSHYVHDNLSESDAIIAITLQFISENVDLRPEQAAIIAQEFVKTASHLDVIVGDTRIDCAVYHGPIRYPLPK